MPIYGLTDTSYEEGKRSLPAARVNSGVWTATTACLNPKNPVLSYRAILMKNETVFERYQIAGLEGIEPSSRVLETRVLPLNDRPKGQSIIAKK